MKMYMTGDYSRDRITVAPSVNPAVDRISPKVAKNYIAAARRRLCVLGFTEDDASIADDAIVTGGYDGGAFVTVSLWVSDADI